MGSTVMNKCPQNLVPIPGPKPVPFLGNILDIDPDNFTKSLGELGKKYGDVYMINYGSYRDVIVVSRKVAEELCDETRFCKLPGGAIDRMRRVVGHGLFTAETADPRYQKAHRVIAPLFGIARTRNMMDDMRDICEQMCLRWARFGADVPIEICDEMTKLTLDTIALCTVDYRFNSFYRPAGVEEPFAEAVVGTMTESMMQSNLPDWINHWIRFRSMNKFNSQADELRRTIEELIDVRRKNPTERNDLLNAMLNHEDPNTGKRLDDESVVDNLLTFFIAGHETTSSLLSFCFYYLLENPEILRKAQAEVDAVVGSNTVMPEHLQKLPYLESILRETLRLRDPGPGFFVKPLKDDVIAGKYPVPKDQAIFIVFDSVHRDPEVYGDDADEFRPERMSQEKFDKLPPCAWKPFGNGMRACIGRPFAMQQAMIAAVMVLQNFDLIKDEAYRLKIHVTMTVRPVGLTMKVRPRNGIRPTEMNLRMHHDSDAALPKPVIPSSTDNGEVHLAIVHASNSGTSEALAGILANNAVERGLGIKFIDTANNVVEKLPQDVIVVVITTSYNGEPARDAVKFVSWLKASQGQELKRVRYAVFGCGHRDWITSFFAIPKLVDSLLSECGAERVTPMGTSDTGGSTDVFSDFEEWTISHLFPKLGNGGALQKHQLACDNDTRDTDLHVSLIKPTFMGMREGFGTAVVTDAQSLSAPGVPEKRHLEIRLPVGFTYESGDHLQILPRNSSHDMRSVLCLFDLEADTLVNIRSMKKNVGLGLPLDTPIRASELFSAYVDLGRTASPRNIQVLAGLVTDNKPELKGYLVSILNAERYKDEVSSKRLSVLDLLKMFPDVKISLASFLSLLVPIRPRAYSFSSSPHWKPGFATLTYTVVGSGSPSPISPFMDQDIHSSDPNDGFAEDCVSFRRGGLASTYLSTLRANDSLYISLHPRSPSFYDDQYVSRPVIMVAAGTGIAPFIAFLQDRKVASKSLQQSGAGRVFKKAILFFGCRGPALDSLYTAELAAFEADGLVEVRRAFSWDQEAAEAEGCKYVSERLAASKEDLVEVWKAGGRVLVCGGKNMANGVFDVLGPLFWETDKHDQKSTAKTVDEWRAALNKDRYVEEFFL